MRDIGHFIGGKTVAGKSGRTGEVYNPATGEVDAKVALASKAELAEAVDALPLSFIERTFDMVFGEAHGGRQRQQHGVVFDERIEVLRDGVAQASTIAVLRKRSGCDCHRRRDCDCSFHTFPGHRCVSSGKLARSPEAE